MSLINWVISSGDVVVPLGGVGDKPGLTLSTAQLLVQFALPWEWIGWIELDKACPAF